MTALRIVVYPHAMEIGGSQLNAIELAAAVRELGHHVSVLSDDGPLLTRVDELGLPRLPLPGRRRRPSPGVARRIRGLVRGSGVDVVHGYEWPPGVEAAAACLGTRAAAVCTVMSMAVAPFLPRYLPLVVGTEAIRRSSQIGRPGPVDLLEPPVDVVANAPGVPTDAFRVRFGLEDRTLSTTGEQLVDVTVVSRLVPELKLEGILTAVDAVGSLAAAGRPVRLVVVGDGGARKTVAQHAEWANARAGRRAVVLTGELTDPRPAYAAADVVLGMGGSALRALAFGRPLVVQGERAFWELLTPRSVDTFLDQGWYGIGDGEGAVERLTSILLPLVADPSLRASLGRFGRELAVERFSLQAAARTQEGIYRRAVAARPDVLRRAADLGRSLGGLFGHKVRERSRRLRGDVARDDFNATEHAAAALRQAGTSVSSPR
ncbi:Glycosyltransferase involved in cell wall bisynthesis [Geodermatophilus saharensis]|uniref:Glycosyltransferase involved in cell wall bisynthesis n=1 Tax=Geodermatophilus saharensis TaxID=1137994 RepID=A0A239GF56_9ACTN|nr:glycosyltransferase family 4 protein [Geodermatophilus saharensis]SNS67535.1 Glycosyltransferase involved in cell wall bisynthesis [Geodermatophilus saharensis]